MAAQRDNWSARPDAEIEDLRMADLAVVVKHISDKGIQNLRTWGGPVVYDPLDFWSPARGAPKRPDLLRDITDVEGARSLFKTALDRVRPDLVLCPTRAMSEDLMPLCKTDVLYHHFDPRLEASKTDRIGPRRVVYNGVRSVLRGWRLAIRSACFFSGAVFVESSTALPPPADAMIAVRGGRHHNWISQRWKSNVKAATAQRLGVPFIAWPEEAYKETHPEAFWFRNRWDLQTAVRNALSAPRPIPETYRYSAAWAANELTSILAKRF